MRKIVGSETTYFFYALGNLVCEFTSTNTGATQAAATDRLQYQTRDKLGSAVLIMNGSLVVENNRTLPYGELWNAQVASSNDKKFTTYQRDQESGLDYADARYYANTNGRFNSPDQGRITLFAPVTLNRYTYAGADPINYTDPGGMYRCIVGAGEGQTAVNCEIEQLPLPRPPISLAEWEDMRLHRIDTFGQARGNFISVVNPSKSGPNQNRITDVMKWIQGNIDSKCANWLSGVNGAINNLLGDPSDSRTVLIGHGEMDRGVGAFTGNNPANTDLPEGYAITVNDLGGFFVGQYAQGGRNYTIRVGNYQGGTSQA